MTNHTGSGKPGRAGFDGWGGATARVPGGSPGRVRHQRVLHLDRGHAGARRPCQSVSRICWPYLASLVSPTPLTVLSSASEDGSLVAISRKVASWKIT